MKNEIQKDAARRALKALPSVFRLVFTLGRYDYLTTEEISLVIGRPVETVRQIERITADMIDYELTFA